MMERRSDEGVICGSGRRARERRRGGRGSATVLDSSLATLRLVSLADVC